MIKIVMEVINLYVMLLILRAWLQFIQADFYNPFSQTIVKLTGYTTQQLRRVLPPLRRIDTASLLVAYGLLLLKFLIGLSFNITALEFVVLIVLGLFDFLYMIGYTVFWVMIVNVILSWVSQGRNPIDAVIYQLTQPLLAPIKRIVPPIGMIDLSVMIFLFALYFLEYLHGQLLGIVKLYLSSLLM